MPKRDLVVIGASAGGVEALTRVISGLPAEFPAAVFVVLHTSPDGRSLLAPILDGAGPLPVTEAHDGEPFQPGHVYTCPPNVHMVLAGEQIRLTHDPAERGHRPGIDALFRSAAEEHGERVVGVILSGTLNDGSAGLRLVKDRGGAALVQDPDDAAFSDMPRNAMSGTRVDRVAKARDMAAVIAEILGEDESPADARMARTGS